MKSNRRRGSNTWTTDKAATGGSERGIQHRLTRAYSYPPKSVGGCSSIAEEPH